MLDTVFTCPLGSKCEEIKDGKIHRCRWYVRIEGKNPQNKQRLDREDCAIAWSPFLSLEIAGTNRGQTEALESFRNEVVKGNEKMTEVMQKSLPKAEPRLLNG